MDYPSYVVGVGLQNDLADFSQAISSSICLLLLESMASESSADLAAQTCPAAHTWRHLVGDNLAKECRATWEARAQSKAPPPILSETHAGAAQATASDVGSASDVGGWTFVSDEDSPEQPQRVAGPARPDSARRSDEEEGGEGEAHAIGRPPEPGGIDLTQMPPKGPPAHLCQPRHLLGAIPPVSSGVVEMGLLATGEWIFNPLHGRVMLVVTPNQAWLREANPGMMAGGIFPTNTGATWLNQANPLANTGSPQDVTGETLGGSSSATPLAGWVDLKGPQCVVPSAAPPPARPVAIASAPGGPCHPRPARPPPGLVLAPSQVLPGDRQFLRVQPPQNSQLDETANFKATTRHALLCTLSLN